MRSISCIRIKTARVATRHKGAINIRASFEQMGSCSEFYKALDNAL